MPPPTYTEAEENTSPTQSHNDSSSPQKPSFQPTKPIAVSNSMTPSAPFYDPLPGGYPSISRPHYQDGVPKTLPSHYYDDDEGCNSQYGSSQQYQYGFSQYDEVASHPTHNSSARHQQIKPSLRLPKPDGNVLQFNLFFLSLPPVSGVSRCLAGILPSVRSKHVLCRYPARCQEQAGIGLLGLWVIRRLSAHTLVPPVKGICMGGPPLCNVRIRS